MIVGGEFVAGNNAARANEIKAERVANRGDVFTGRRGSAAKRCRALLDSVTDGTDGDIELFTGPEYLAFSLVAGTVDQLDGFIVADDVRRGHKHAGRDHDARAVTAVKDDLEHGRHLVMRPM